MIARGLVLAVAVVAAAWFALGADQAIDTSQATALITRPSPLSAGQVARAHSLLSSASTLNPDKTPDILRGQLASDQHDFASAVRTLETVTSAEPQNLSAWIQLAFAAGRAGDRSELTLAGRQISYLFPKLSH